MIKSVRGNILFNSQIKKATKVIFSVTLAFIIAILSILNQFPYQTNIIYAGQVVDSEDPTVPNNLINLSSTNGTVDLMWDCSTDNIEVVGYKIYRDGVEIGSTLTTEYTDTDLKPNKTYSYFVLAFDEAKNESSASNKIYVTPNSKTNLKQSLEMSEIHASQSENKSSTISLNSNPEINATSESLFASVGADFTIMKMLDGTVRSWGRNTYGQLGLGDSVNRDTPTIIPGLAGLKQLTSGNAHSLALLEDGTVKAWGYNNNGQLGLGNTLNTSTATMVSGLTGVKQIVAGYDHSLALMSDGTVRAWGNNAKGQLGLGDVVNRNTPTVIPGLTGVTQLAAGLNDSFALMEDGTVKAWGANDYGKLGTGDTANKSIPTLINNLTEVTELSAGYDHVLALIEDGTVKVWGNNGQSRLGLGDTVNRSIPTNLPSLGGVKKVTAGRLFSIAYLENGTALSWGANPYGQLGVGDTAGRTTPTLITGLNDIRTIVTGATSHHTVSVINDGTVKIWGYNYYGQLGLGDTVNRTIPTLITSIIYNSIPSVKIISPEPNNIFSEMDTNYVPSISVSDANNDDLVCKYFIDSETSPRETKNVQNTITEQTVNFSGLNVAELSEGNHTVRFEVFDNIGNPITSIIDVKVDKSGPVIKVESVISTTSTLTVNVSAVDNISGLNPLPFRFKVNSETTEWTSSASYTTQNKLTPNTQYPICIEARDIKEHITICNSSIYTKAEEPNLAAGSKSSDSMKILISDNNPLSTQYQIEVNNGEKYVSESGSLTQTPEWITIPEKSKLITGLSPNTVYSYKVKARNGDNIETVWSSIVSESTMEENPGTDIPSAPLNLTYQLYNRNVELKWDAPTSNADIVGYKIFQNQIEIGTTNNTAYNVTALESDKVYYFTVKAYNAAGVLSEASNEISVTIGIGNDTEPPTVPINTTASAITVTSVNLSWDPSSDNVGVVGYKIFRDSIEVGTTAETSYTDINLTQGSSYVYNIKAYDAAGNISEASTDITVTTIPAADNESPSSPTNLGILSNTKASVSLSWDASFDNVGVKGYRIYRNDFPITDVYSTSFTDTGLEPGNSYIYKVKAFDDAGNISEFSNEITFTSDESETCFPGNFSASVSGEFIYLSWDAVEGAIGYDISVNGEIRRINATEYQHLDVQINQEYSYKIRTVYESGTSDWSSEIKKTYQENEIVPPQILANPKTNKIELSWNSVENVTGYELYIDGEIINVGNVLVYTHTNLLSNTKHTYKVRCIYGNNQSEWSEVLELNTKTLEKPSNIISKSYVSSIELKWDVVPEAESYEIEINNKTKVVTKEPIFKHTNLFSNKSYSYKIRAINSGGVGEWSEAITSITGELTAPINLEFSVTNKQIVISWDPVPEAVYYDVWIDGNTINNGSSTQYTHLNLNPATEYTYKVRALNSQGSGLWSQTYTVKTLLLDTPANIKTTGTSNSVYLNWDRVDYATSYEIEIDEGTIITTETTSYINDNLTQNSVHTYRIRAKNSNGLSAWSNAVTQNTANLEDGIKGQWFSDNQNLFYRYLAGSTQLNGKIYLVGGCRKIWNGTKLNEAETAINEEYDPVSNTVVTRASMPTPRYGLAVVSLNGKIYAIGGMHEGKFVNTVEEYDPSTDTWTAKADMPTARMNLGAVALNGKIYAVGGGGGNIYLGYVDCVEEYDPLTDTWTKRASMPTARYSLSLVAFNDKIYAIGGYDNNLSLNNIEVFDPNENIWTEKGVMPTARQGAGAVASNGKIFLMGGQKRVGPNTINPVDMVEEYDPLTNLCRTLTPLPGTSDYPISVQAIEDKFYVFIPGDSYFITTFVLSAPSNKPSIPNDVFTTISSNEITLNWDLVSTATGYDVEIDGDKIVSVVTNNYIHTQLTPGLAHTYRVRVKNISGNGEWSDSISAIVPDVKYSADIMPKMTANNEPAGYTIVGNDYGYLAFDNDRTTPWYESGAAPAGGHYFIIDFGAETPKVINKINLTSSSSDSTNSRGIKNWEIWVSQDGNNYTKLTKGRQPNDGKYHDYIFNNSNAYRYYRLNILDSYLSSPSDCCVYEMELMTSQEMIIGLETPTNFKAASINENSISLTWSEVLGATEYEIDMDGILFKTTGTSYSIGNLLPRTKHNFRVRGKSATQYSDWSSVLSVSTLTEKIDDPYIISSIEDLLNIKNNLSGSYKLVNDIDLNNTEWESIGSSKTPFIGIFDGNGHTIKNLKIDKATNKYLGLFGVTNNATIKNVSIENISINGTECVGALLGQANGSVKIENCKIFGICNINGKSNLGGLVGYVYDGGTITGSSANVIITDSSLGSGYIGGLAGKLNNTILSKCFSSGDIISRDSYVGGLVGYADGSKISECYAVGNVKGSSNVGGLAGRFSSHDGIDNCYSLVNVVSDSLDLVGGFIGYANTDVKNCYSTGSVSTTKVTNVGGFVGGKGNTFEIINCYYDGVAAKYIPQNELDTSKLTYSMLRPETFRGWDFDSIWCIDQNKSYPYLRNVDNSSQVFNGGYNGNMEGGKGTPENPYIIKSKEQLSNMKYEPSASYKLASDIDLGDFDWKPIGNYTVPFTGDFDGTGYTIRNLKIDKTSTNYLGLFGVIENANIKSVVIENADIKGKNYVGALIGQANGTVEIKNCKILGNCSINGTSYLGGLVGDVADGGSITGCSAKINITSTNTSSVNIGGLAGSLDNTTVSKCYATGVIKGNSYVGGLIGITVEGNVSECYSTGDVFGQKYVGGLIGDADDREKSHKINNCYSLANVKSAIDGSYIGGFVGYSYLATIENCYATGTIALTTSFTKGGFIGNGQKTSSSTLVNCFYDGVSAKYIPQYELDISKLTFSMTRRETFSGWDFDNIWQIDENKSYPYLRNIDNPTQVFIEGNIADVEGGKGTPEDPYIIKSKGQLNNIRYELSASYKLAGGIDLGNFEWESIGNSSAPFTGEFDGNGYKISNLKIDKTTQDYLGLFGAVKDANLNNVVIENVDIKGQKYIGALAGQASGNIQIQNCKVLGNCKINGDSYIGGLAGYVFEGGNITNCSTEVNITSNIMKAGYIGGLIGKINLTTISKCFSEGDIGGKCNYSGGLVGYETNGNISLSYATGNITSEGSDIGGLIGHADGGNVTESYASGNIKGSMYVGGFVGYLWATSQLNLNMSNCYALGNVEAKYYVAGFAGIDSTYSIDQLKNCYSTGSVTCSDEKGKGGFSTGTDSDNCYFNSNNSTSTTPIDQAKTTAQLMQQSTFIDWDFANIWGISEGMSYPFLKNIPNPSGINVAFKEITNDSISIEWNLINGVDNYELEIDGETTVSLTQSNYVHLQLQPNTTHKYRVRYHKQTVTSEWSPMVSATTLAVVIPTPQNLQVAYDKGQILVCWNKVTEAKEYEVEVDGKVINVGTALTYVHKNFADISQHTYRVRAKNSLATSKWSNIVSEIGWKENVPAVCLVEGNWLTPETSGDDIEVIVKANNITNMYTVLLELEYNPSELAVNKDNIKQLIWVQANNAYFEYVVDEAAGKIKVLISGTADKEAKSGLIDLLCLRLKLKSVENSILKVKKAVVVDNSIHYILTPEVKDLNIHTIKE